MTLDRTHRYGDNARVLTRAVIAAFHGDWPYAIPGDEHGDVEYAITRAEWAEDRRRAALAGS